jgi:hypothetical protein
MCASQETPAGLMVLPVNYAVTDGSIVIRTGSHRVLQPGELRNLREGCDLRPWPAGGHDLFIRIVPAQLTGRRIRSQ